MFFCLGWFFLNNDKVLKTAIWSLNMAFLIREDMTTGIATFLKDYIYKTWEESSKIAAANL